MKKNRIFQLLFILILLALTPSTVFAQSTPDIIREYLIDLQPQEDASLINTYTIHWCVLSDALGPLTDFYVGMPNGDYQILDFNGDVSSVRSANQGAFAQVNILLSHPISAGECAAVTFRIHQNNIAHRDEAKGEIGFQFIPGWFDEVAVEHLQLTWHLPVEAAQLKSIIPEPKTQDASQAVWETSLPPSSKFTINLLYDQTAFPGFGKTSTPIWPLSGGETASESAETNDALGSSGGEQNPAESSKSQLGGFLPISLTTCICILLVFILVIGVVISSLSRGVRSYRTGGSLGSPWLGRGPVILPPGHSRGSGGVFGGENRGSIDQPQKRSGGGGGLFGGRGSSCACVSCACACACAGGGRAGCSRKGFDISGLLKNSPAGQKK